jgi:hypothetical protein
MDMYLNPQVNKNQIFTSMEYSTFKILFSVDKKSRSPLRHIFGLSRRTETKETKIIDKKY